MLTANDNPGSPAIKAQIESAAPVPTSPHGSDPASTPSITVFISVACGAGSSGEPNVNALPSSRTVPAIAQHANAAPMNWPSCWRAGVAPTRKPVFKSCEMSPAFDAAMQTTVPTVRIAARADGSRQPRRTKTTETPRSVTSVIADVGFDETPINPTIRDETTTNAIPKIATPIAATNRGAVRFAPTSAITGVSTSAEMRLPETMIADCRYPRM